MELFYSVTSIGAFWNDSCIEWVINTFFLKSGEKPDICCTCVAKSPRKGFIGMNDKGILLETGTNEVEVLELLVGGLSYGVNVLKVKQIVSYDPKSLTKIYGLNPSVKGMFLFRDQSVPLIDLAAYFGHEKVKTTDLVAVICEFNRSVYGFLVEGLTKIYRISWDQIQSPTYLVQKVQAMITGIVPIEGREIMIMDLESIVGETIGRRRRPVEAPVGGDGFDPADMRLIIADDSALVRQQVSNILKEAGFKGVVVCVNGQEALDKILDVEDNAPDPNFDLLITDIEMPLLDGLTLCKKVKGRFPSLKVMVLSSLITEQMIAKCNAVNADAHVSKAEPETLIEKIQELLPLAQAES